MIELTSDRVHEDKQVICNLLCTTLMATDAAHDIVSIKYEKTAKEEVAIVTFLGGGTRRINVALDSGTAMIRDIMSHLGC